MEQGYELQVMLILIVSLVFYVRLNNILKVLPIVTPAPPSVDTHIPLKANDHLIKTEDDFL